MLEYIQEYSEKELMFLFLFFFLIYRLILKHLSTLYFYCSLDLEDVYVVL